MKQILHILKAPSRGLRRLYNWTTHWSKSRKAPYALFGISFVESSFFPIPPDVLLIPMVVHNIKRWWQNALICTIGSVSGALLGYAIGYIAFEFVGQPIINFYGMQDKVAYVGERFNENAFWFIFTAAFTPIPYKVITVGAGLFHVALPILIIASLVGRGGRFFLVAGCLRIFGRKIADSIDKYFDIFSILFVLLLVGGFLLVKYII